MRKLAMFGGTFNPVHSGHVRMALDFARQLELDKVYLIPTNIPPHKAYREEVSGQDRLEMCRLAAEGYPELAVSAIELEREGPSYTVDTLRELHRRAPDAEWYLITGADMFLTLLEWKEPDELFRLATICAVPREKSDISILQTHANELKCRKARTRLLDLPRMSVSSTQIREILKKGGSITGLVPRPVEQYILQHNLYRE